MTALHSYWDASNLDVEVTNNFLRKHIKYVSVHLWQHTYLFQNHLCCKTCQISLGWVEYVPLASIYVFTWTIPLNSHTQQRTLEWQSILFVLDKFAMSYYAIKVLCFPLQVLGHWLIGQWSRVRLSIVQPF